MSDGNQIDPDLLHQFQSLFGEFFGGNGQRSLRVDLELTDDEAKTGVTREVAIDRSVACTTCEGRGGATPADVRKPCTTCNATGHVQSTQGFLVVQVACHACRGAKSTIANPCTPCRGAGTVQQPGTLTIVVPPNVQHEQMLRIPDADATIFVHMRVGGRPTQMELAMRMVSPEPIPTARLVPTAEDRKRNVLAIAAMVIFAVLAYAMLRH